MDAAETVRDRPMRVLFSMRNFWYVKLFESVIRELASRGHHVHVLAERGEHNEGARDWNDAAAALAAEHPTITFAWAPREIEDDWADLRVMIRLSLDHLRFLEPAYAEAPMLGERARRRTPAFIVTLTGWPVLRTRPGRRLMAWVLKRLERAIPADPHLASCIASHEADVILVTPMLTLGSEQVDVLRVARGLGVPTALCVGSWDHLSSKALIRDLPDRVFVWNETQKHEAITLHRVPEERIVVTGAQCFDRWFGRSPSRDRETFCREVGLPADRPFILYVCSAPFIGSQPEAPFVAEWVRHIRASLSPRLRHAPILVRPHPSRRSEWNSVDLSGLPDVVLWGSNPVDAGSRADYFDSLYHSAAVVGLNTSAFIEAGIAGRPVLTILLPEWHENQLGTVHFRYLFEAGGGLLTSAHTFDEHLAQIDGVLAAPAAEVRPFIRSFVRPYGLDVPATPIFVAAVEAMQGIAVAPPVRPWFEARARRLLAKILPWRDEPGREHLVYAERERETVVRLRASRAMKAERERALKRQRAAERVEREAARDAELEQHRAAKKAHEEAESRPAAR